MLLIKTISVAMITLLICIILRKLNPDLAAAAAVSGGVLILMMIWEPFKQILIQLEQLSRESIVEDKYIDLIIRAVMLTLTGEIAVSMCQEAGEHALGQKVEMASRILLLSMSMPVVLSVLEMFRQWGNL